MTNEQKKDILVVRKNIDAIDSKILSLLKERIGYARDIGRLKDEGNRAKWDPLRERQ
ncbi:MAG: prephenate dehydratase, partial [Desulfobulbaceae bacterium]